MRRWRRRPRRPDWVTAPAGERLLAAAEGDDFWLVGTDRSLVLLEGPDAAPQVWPWETIHAADWSSEESRLRVRMIGSFGEPREERLFSLDDARLLLQLVRERISASVLYRCHHAITGQRGLRVIARRSPAGGEVAWMVEYDARVDPHAPGVPEVAAAALDRGRRELGDSI